MQRSFPRSKRRAVPHPGLPAPVVVGFVALLLAAALSAAAQPAAVPLAPKAAVPAPAATAAAPAPAAAPAAPEPMRWVILIRHGDYDRDAAADDRTGNGLNALGHEQSQWAGKRLAALPVPVGRLVCSDYTRARETAAEIGALLGRTAEVDSLLHECTPQAARADYMKNHAPEEIAACDAALQAAWAKYCTPPAAQDTRDVLVCHGNVIRWFVCRALGADTTRWSSLDIGNGSMTVIQLRADGSTRLAGFSDVGHIPPGNQTSTGRGAGWALPRSR